MSSPASLPLRLARVCGVAVVAVALGAAGHAAVSGTPIRPGLAGGVAIVVAAVLWAASGHEMGTGLLIAVMSAAQGAVHVAGVAASLPQGTHGSGAVSFFCDVSDHASGVAGGGATPMLLMIASHVLAAVVVACILRRGERWLWSLTVTVARLVRAALGLWVPRDRASGAVQGGRADSRAIRPARRPDWTTLLTHRGPPAASATA